VKYHNAAAFRQALEHRLKARPDSAGAGLARNRKRVAFDRLLARLAAVAPGQWVLKGGFALDLRFGTRARTTKDIDIGWQADADDLLDVLIDVADHDLGDFFAFAIERSTVPAERLGGSHRFAVAAWLAGRVFESFLLDVGFLPHLSPATDTLVTDDLLAFADILPVCVDTIPLEEQVAEKVHAYTRRYADGRRSSRTKDLVDLALITELETLDATTLRDAIEITFSLRATHARPQTLPPPPVEWAPQFRRLAAQVGITPDVRAGHATASAMLDPVLAEEVQHGQWNPTIRQWMP
jgi:predicted nucleotidyltransferase component of viral defense system